MEKIINSFKICVTALGVMLTRLLGGWDIWMKALLLFMLLDIVTGLIKARMCKREKSKSGAIDSTVMWNGGLKKLVTIAIIMVAALADSFLGNGTMLIRTTAAAYYVSCEALSVLENAAACGLPLPKGLKNALEKLKYTSDNTENGKE